MEVIDNGISSKAVFALAIIFFVTIFEPKGCSIVPIFLNPTLSAIELISGVTAITTGSLVEDSSFIIDKDPFNPVGAIWVGNNPRPCAIGIPVIYPVSEFPIP